MRFKKAPITAKQVFFRIGCLANDINCLANHARKYPKDADSMMERIIELAEEIEQLYSTKWF